MNNLSWFLYVADVIGSLSLTILAIAVVWATFGTFNLIKYKTSREFDQNDIVKLANSTYKYSYEKEDRANFILQLTDKTASLQEKTPPSVFLWAVLPTLLIIFSILLPSKEAVYLIAGSEAGEAVVTSEEGKEILSDIHMVIKHQLSELKGVK